MGAGCWYTTNGSHNRIKAFWVEIPDEIMEEDDLGFSVQTYREDLETNLASEFNYIMYKLSTESTYNGDGIVIHCNVNSDRLDDRTYRLANYNIEATYRKIAVKLRKMGYTLRTATSGYTSTEYCPE